MSIPRRRFGVEIECNNLPCEEVIQWALDRKGLKVTENTSGWRIEFDASITGPSNRFEIISPILVGAEGLAEVRRACSALKFLGAKTNKSCGLHVHVSTDKLRPNHLYSMLGRYAKWEKKIDKFVIPFRRESKNGATVSVNKDWRFALDCYENPEDRERLFRSNSDFASFIESGHCKKLDFDSIWNTDTVEFRHHHGTIEPREVSNWIQFCLNFTEISADMAPGSRRRKRHARDTGPLMCLPSRIQRHFKRQRKKLR